MDMLCSKTCKVSIRMIQTASHLSRIVFATTELRIVCDRCHKVERESREAPVEIAADPATQVR